MKIGNKQDGGCNQCTSRKKKIGENKRDPDMALP